MATHARIRDSKDIPKQRLRFTKPEDLQQRLRDQNEASLTETLNALRNQLTIKHDEGNIASSDERFVFAKSWLDASSGAYEIFEVWERVNTRQLLLLVPIISALTSVLDLLSNHYAYQSQAASVVKTLLTPKWTSKLNTYLSTAKNELILVTLKLYNSLSSFARGRERRAIFEAFPWDLKALPKLMHMRRRNKSEEDATRPDIRTLFVSFILCFVDSTTSSTVKAMFLEQRRDLFVAIFKGLYQDSYAVVRKVLEVCWVGIWLDPKIKRTVKIGLFNETTVGQILRLYERNTPEGPTQEDIPADVAHHFLLAICTRPGTGICFKDHGWYPREEAEDGRQRDVVTAGSSKFGGRVYNKILANILKTLKVNEDARQEELAHRIITACPELVAGYWPAAALTLEPRLSSRWIANIAFFGRVISLPVPEASFLLPDSDLYQPSPPPLTSITENILPSVNMRVHLSRGLQSNSPLVQHCTAIALAKSLMKYGAVLQAFRTAETALEEDDEGQWSKRRREVEREIARRVPEFQVVVAFTQQTGNDLHALSEVSPNQIPVKAALLAECAQRLLWLYYEWLPVLVAEVRFDASKLLQSVQDDDVHLDTAIEGLVRMRRLHILRLLKESDQFSWSSKTGSSRGNFNILLKLYTTSDPEGTRPTVSALLHHTLCTTMLFQHDVNELDLWLAALPSTERAASAKAPDDTPLTDEGDAVVAFLDDCAQRCMKTPYRYFEDLQKIWATENHGEDVIIHAEVYPSPMLATVLEQLDVKLSKNILAPSDVLAILTFIRMLVWNLTQKAHSIKPLLEVAKRVETLLPTLSTLPLSLSAASSREIRIMSAGLIQLVQPSPPSAPSVNPVVEEFLNRVEETPLPSNPKERKIAASELVDWYRLADQPLDNAQFQRLLGIVAKFHPSECQRLFSHSTPSEGLLWAYLNAPVLDERTAKNGLGFPLAFMHSYDVVLANKQSRDVLVESLFDNPGSLVTRLKASFRLIDLRLVSPAVLHISMRCGLLLLLHSITAKLKSIPIAEKDSILLQIIQLEGIRLAAQSVLAQADRSAFDSLLGELSTIGTECKHAIAALASPWVAVLQEDVDTLLEDQVATATMWIRFAEPSALVTLLEHICDVGQLASNHSIKILESLLSAFERNLLQLEPSFFTARLSRLLNLRPHLPNSPILDKLVDFALSGMIPSFLDGRLGLFDTENTTLAEMLSLTRWSHPQHLHLERVDVTKFLDQHLWTDHTTSIVAKLVYGIPSARSQVVQWLRNSLPKIYRITVIVPIVHALLDCSAPSSWHKQDCDVLAPIFVKIIQELAQGPASEDASSYIGCVALLPRLSSTLSAQVLSAMHQEYAQHQFNRFYLRCALQLSMNPASAKCAFVETVMYAGLEWALAYGTSDRTPEVRQMTSELLHILKATSEVKAHLVEPFLNGAIQSHLGDEAMALLACEIVAHAKLKPVTANRYLQNIVQQPQIHVLCSVSSRSRHAVITLLYRLFYMHPTNSCQASHVEPLTIMYGGTLSSSDRKLLSIFALFERTRKVSVASLLAHWSPSDDVSSETVLQPLQILDPSRSWRTCLQFPQWISYLVDEAEDQHDDELYDPSFLALAFSRMITDDAPISATSWVQLFRTNIVSIFIRSLSSHREDLRRMALLQLVALQQRLQEADMYEKPHVLYILDLLKDLYPKGRSDEYPERLSAYATLHLAHALRGVFYPSHFTYPLTARFLLQRPELDSGDIPALYTMLYSTSDLWRRERMWMVRFLADGMVGRQEWKVLLRRHTWDLVSSVFSNEERDPGLRRSVLEFLANITCNKHATTSLLLTSALLPWIELQVQKIQGGESLAWVKILENIVVVVDFSKIEASTNGEWRSTVSRCLLTLLASKTCTQDILAWIMQVLSRLSHLPGSSVMHGDDIVRDAMTHLTKIEKTLQLTEMASFSQSDLDDKTILVAAPHSSRRLWDTKVLGTCRVWGLCVEALWTVAMSSSKSCPEWLALTHRMLLWRAVVGDSGGVAEWVRREVCESIELSRYNTD